jgi:hypothetical protein
MIKEIHSSETSVLLRPTRHHIPEEAILYIHRSEDLKYYEFKFVSVLTLLSNMLQSSMGGGGGMEHSTTFLVVGTRWIQVVRPYDVCLTPFGIRVSGAHWLGGLVGPRIGVENVQKVKILHC